MRRLLFIFLSGLALFSVWFFVTRTPFPSEQARKSIGNLAGTQADLNNIKRSDFYTSGTGSDVIMYASAGREVSDFNELIKDLNANNYRTIAVESPVIIAKTSDQNPTLETFSDPINLAMKFETRGPVVLIGHAFGNRATRFTAYQYPENVKAVILLAAGGQIPMEPKAEQSLRDIFNPMKSHKARMEDVEYAFFAEGNDIPDHWTRGWHTKTAIAQGKAVAASAGDDSWHCAGGIPMLIVQPMQDRIAPIENAYALRDKCPQEIEIVEIQNAGHALLPEQPGAVAGAVLAFLAKHHPVE